MNTLENFVHRSCHVILLYKLNAFWNNKKGICFSFFKVTFTTLPVYFVDHVLLPF